MFVRSNTSHINRRFLLLIVVNVHTAEIAAQPRIHNLRITRFSLSLSHLGVGMFVVMHRDFAARSERNRQHSADRPQNDRPDHETADDHDLKESKDKKERNTG